MPPQKMLPPIEPYLTQALKGMMVMPRSMQGKNFGGNIFQESQKIKQSNPQDLMKFKFTYCSMTQSRRVD